MHWAVPATRRRPPASEQRQVAPAPAEAVIELARAGETAPRRAAHGAPPQRTTTACSWSGCSAASCAQSTCCGSWRPAACAAWAARAFRPWRKWVTVAGQPGPRRYVVNVDEGEVGTFKDWHLLAHDPRPALEGLLIAAAVVGLHRLWI